MPGGPDVGANIKELTAANKIKPPGQQRPRKQIIAIAESQARKASRTGVGSDKHPGFSAVQGKIAKSEGISKDRAGAILAASTRGASKAAKKKNPALKKVK